VSRCDSSTLRRHASREPMLRWTPSVATCRPTGSFRRKGGTGGETLHPLDLSPGPDCRHDASSTSRSWRRIWPRIAGSQQRDGGWTVPMSYPRRR